MYPKDCCKIQPSDCKPHSNSLHSYYTILSSYHDLLASLEGHEFDNIAYNIIPFVSMWFAFDYCFFTTFSRYLNQIII